MHAGERPQACRGADRYRDTPNWARPAAQAPHAALQPADGLDAVVCCRGMTITSPPRPLVLRPSDPPTLTCHSSLHRCPHPHRSAWRVPAFGPFHLASAPARLQPVRITQSITARCTSDLQGACRQPPTISILPPHSYPPACTCLHRKPHLAVTSLLPRQAPAADVCCALPVTPDLHRTCRGISARRHEGGGGSWTGDGLLGSTDH